MKKHDLARMLDWLVWALLFHGCALVLRQLQIEPPIQTVLWKLGNLTLSAYAGYWIDRRAFRMRVDTASPAGEHIRRAIIIAAAMVSVGLGL